MSLEFGDDRPGGPAKVAIGVATVLLFIVAAGLGSSGGSDRFLPLLVVVPLYGLFVLWVLVRRRVTVSAPDRAVVVTRTLCGLRWTRRFGFGAFTGVRCRGLWLRPRGGSPFAGTPEGDARFIKFDLSLRRRWGALHLGMLSDVDQAEAMARDAARCIGVPAERRDYALRADGLPLWRRGARSGLG